ncbi:hypothetical protein [Nocardia cyriacigeorgica]|uniref:hypothetical protein n=1 Tax=Nocardia cyriacigeorgica TaxID=135487 RepID=UPI002454D92A|nr:hypothetical protein [Nocardia cyriacigeorgica]
MPLSDRGTAETRMPVRTLSARTVHPSGWAAQMDDEWAYAAALALRAARNAVQQWASTYEENTRRIARYERALRIAAFDRMLTVIEQRRQMAIRDGDDRLANELDLIKRQKLTEDLVGRWAAAEANRHCDADLADAWSTRLDGAGITPRVALTIAERIDHTLPLGPPIEVETLAIDYAEMAMDLSAAPEHYSADSTQHLRDEAIYNHYFDVARDWDIEGAEAAHHAEKHGSFRSTLPKSISETRPLNDVLPNLYRRGEN